MHVHDPPGLKNVSSLSIVVLRLNLIILRYCSTRMRQSSSATFLLGFFAGKLVIAGHVPFPQLPRTTKTCPVEVMHHSRVRAWACDLKGD